jgi:hypothetical protein
MTPRLNQAVSATAASIAATSSPSVRLRAVMSWNAHRRQDSSPMVTVSAETRQSTAPPPFGWNRASKPRTLPVRAKLRLELPAHPRVRPQLAGRPPCGRRPPRREAHGRHEGVVDVHETVVVDRSDGGRDGRQPERLGEALLALLQGDLRLRRSSRSAKVNSMQGSAPISRAGPPRSRSVRVARQAQAGLHLRDRLPRLQARIARSRFSARSSTSIS